MRGVFSNRMMGPAQMIESKNVDPDPDETQEWLDALSSVLQTQGVERVQYLLQKLSVKLTEQGSQLPYAITTPYRNTIPSNKEARMPGDLFVERNIRSLIRWNAMAMVMRANIKDGTLGGHISTFQSSATLYDVGFNYFFRANQPGSPGDLLYIQGHSAPGIYARSFLEEIWTRISWIVFGRKSMATVYRPILILG